MEQRKLNSLNIKSLKHLSLQLAHPLPELISVCDNIEKYYRSGDRLVKGKLRHIDEPVADLRRILDKLQGILSRIELPDYLHGGRKGHSIFTNAKVHVRQAAVLNFDIQDFFPSIHCPRVERMFLNLGCSRGVASILTRLTTYEGCVPHGSPTSTVVANLCVAPLADRINTLAQRHQSRFSQFVDDGIMSGPAYIGKLRTLIDRIIRQEGFTASPKPDKRQTRYWHEEQVATGVKVNRRIDVPAAKLESIRNDLALFKERVCSGKRPTEQEVNVLRGKIQHLNSFNSKTANAICRDYEAFAKSHVF